MTGIVQCFLCDTFISLKNGESTLQSHMNQEHNASFGMDFLYAGCIMNEEERDAMINVVEDRQPHSFIESEDSQENGNDSIQESSEVEMENDKDEENNAVFITALTPETTLQEIDTAVEEEEGVSPPRMNTKPVIKFSCPECPLTFNLKIKLNIHLKLHDKKDRIVGEIYGNMKETKKEGKPKTADRPKQGPRVWTPKEGEMGVPCPKCGKEFKSNGPMQRHFEDIHQTGEFPCKGCGKIFTSKNKMSSHYSRNCNPLNPNSRRRKTIF